MFGLEDEDDEDFTVRPETSSKLANLFESNEIHLDIDSSNKSLKYIPPKQPKRFEINSNSSEDNASNTSNTSNSSVMTLIHAMAVNVFKFENGKYTAQGKLGSALLGNHDTRSYKLILYTGKQQHITYASINENFKLISQPNNYLSFYDDNRQNWSVMFDTEEEKLNFSRQLTICKFNSIPKTDNESRILTQDLIVINESNTIAAEDNDNIELRYKGWLFEEYQVLGKLFAKVDESSKKPLRIKLIGKWAQILKGMRIGNKRFAVFSPNIREQLTGILENAPISHNCKYGFDFEIVKIQPRIQSKPEIKPQKQSKEEKSSEQKETDIEKNSEHKSHSNSLNESLKSDETQSKTKTDLLTRVTRMGGLPILPFKTDPKPEQTQHKDAIDAKEDESTQLKPVVKPRTNSNDSKDNKISGNDCNEKYSNSQIPFTSAYNSMTFPQYFGPQSIESNISLMSAEFRSNQTEIRMNLTKIVDKIDTMSEKISEIKNNSSPQLNPMSISGIGFMDSAILLSSIQRIITENGCLKKEVEEKTSNLQKLNEKIVDLLHMQNTNAQNNSQELTNILMSEKILKKEINNLTESCNKFRTQTEELSAENNRLKATVEQIKSESENYKRNYSRESGFGISKDSLTIIKRLMNDVFRKINSQIDENKSYDSNEIIEIVSNSIKSTTLSLMETQNNSRTNSPFRQPVDEIDKNIENLNLKPEINKEVEKPPIPQRKSIEAQQQIIKNTSESVVSKNEINQKVEENTE